MSTQRGGTSRRRFLAAGGAGLATGVLGAVATRELAVTSSPPAQVPPASPPQSSFVDPHGPHQSGVHLPLQPPAQLNFHVYGAIAAAMNRDNLQRTLEELGRTITSLMSLPRDPRLSADPEELTIQVGVGARVLALAEIDVPVTLPEFAGSAALPATRRDGDLVIAVAARHPETTAQASDAIAEVLAESGFDSQWSQIAFRPRGEGMVTLNPLGFDDGIVQPEASSGVPEHVFLTEGVAAGGTVGVVRRFTLDTAGFGQLSVKEQEAVFGRVKSTGAPLSGGEQFTDPNLLSKTPTGEYLIPNGSHVRAAHPSFTASTVMLRRSYGFRESVDGQPDRSGLLFLSFQDDVQVFARTHQRMDREDRLMEFATPTAEVAFLVLPGFTPTQPLGSALFPRTLP